MTQQHILHNTHQLISVVARNKFPLFQKAIPRYLQHAYRCIKHCPSPLIIAVGFKSGTNGFEVIPISSIESKKLTPSQPQRETSPNVGAEWAIGL